MAFSSLERQLCKGARELRRTVGFRGGNVRGPVYWHEDERFWHLMDDSETDRFWCCYGAEDPTSTNSLNITVEINPPRESFNRRLRGAFVKEPGGQVFLAHSGGVGGGRKGIGRSAFLPFYGGKNRITVLWPDGGRSEMILVGALGSRSLRQQVGAFVHEVHRFKAQVDVGKAPTSSLSRTADDAFDPEFERRRGGYAPRSAVESACNGGLIVGCLREALERIGLTALKDRHRDLYVSDRSGRVKYLFAVSTGMTAADLYAGVGRLMIHGSRQADPPLQVLVLPRGVNPTVKPLLKRLGIRLVEYTWEGREPSFEGIMAFRGQG
jgi:hypothetical protein